MKRLLPLAAVVAVLSAVAASMAFALGSESGPESAEPAPNANGGAVAAVCAVEAPDCEDMIVVPDGDEDVEAGSAGPPDKPGAMPPIRSDEGIDPGECNPVHNIDACGDEELRRAGVGAAYDVTIPFDASVTDGDLALVEEVLRSYDGDAAFVVQESFPPTGRASVTSAADGFCAAIESELETIASVGDVGCEQAQEAPSADPDAPVTYP